MYSKFLKIAAQCLGGEDADPSYLNYSLIIYLCSLDSMCEEAGGGLRSRQVISLAVLQWMSKNPNEEAYDKKYSK